MAAPEGYTKLGLIGYTDKGTYSASSTYNRYNVVLFEGSSYVALKDNLTGVEPANDGTNWRIFAQGFNIQNAVTTDNFQATLQNYIANNGTTNQAGFAADARQLNPEVEGSLAAQVSELNANISNLLKEKICNGGQTDVYGSIYFESEKEMIILESMIKVNSVIYLAIPYKLDYLQNMYGFTFFNAQTYNPIEKDITIPSFKYLVIEI